MNSQGERQLKSQQGCFVNRKFIFIEDTEKKTRDP